MNRIDRSVRHKKSLAQELASTISELYFLLKPQYTEDMTHQSVRVLQFIQMSPHNPRVDDVRQHLGVAPTSASELVKRLAIKGMVERRRSQTDERVVELALTEKGRLTLEQQTQMDVSKLAACLSQLQSGEDKSIVAGLNQLLAQAHRLTMQDEDNARNQDLSGD